MIEIIDESTGETERYALNVGTAKRIAVVEVIGNKQVHLNFNIAGPIQWAEAKAFIEGILELSVTADDLAYRLVHEQGRRAVRRPPAPKLHRRRPNRK